MTDDKTYIPFAEQETAITVDYELEIAYVYSSHRPTIHKLHKMVEDYPDEADIEFDDQYGTLITVPIKWISVKPPRRYSEEQRQKKQDQLMRMMNGA